MRLIRTHFKTSFSIAHELYHYFYDGEKTSIKLYSQSNLKVEKEANLFASYLLIPDSSFTRFY